MQSVCSTPEILRLYTGKAPIHRELTLGTGRETRKQCQTLTQALKTKQACEWGWWVLCTEGHGRAGNCQWPGVSAYGIFISNSVKSQETLVGWF